MNRTIRVEGRVEELVPAEAEEEQVHTQYVKLNVSGKELDVMDREKVLDDEHEGQELELELEAATVNAIERSDEPELSTGNYKASFSGEVTAVSESARYVKIDFGAGEGWFPYNHADNMEYVVSGENEPPEEGEFIKFKGARLYLKDTREA